MEIFRAAFYKSGLYHLKPKKSAAVVFILFGFGFVYGFKKKYDHIQRQSQIKKSNIDENVPEPEIQPQPQPQPQPKPPSRIQLVDIKKSELLEQIYNETLRARDVPEEFKPFIGDQKGQDYLLEEYGLNNQQVKQQLQTLLNGMRRARGDGNCFYTSFGFQYLRHMFTKASDQQFEEFIKMIQSLPFSVIHSEQLYEQNEEMCQKFLNYCEYLRTVELEQREQEFLRLFSNPEEQFYGLCIIFLRNLIYKFCFEDEETKNIFEAFDLDLQKQILTWEYDCENNQSVINILTRKLHIDIILYFIDEDSRKLQVQEYKIGNAQTLLEIHIIFRPGHYNVAIPNQ
ncbi:unnamed protein product (macronuclear) [Paramecium tetraurelia]|uniref:ubiquitinyl hydrolase 1 n=1 Tax=Paramecium tetraurelia TaxID=5888 RepID=A0BCF3_PARTE|nr:uncharacterized protein GSPATT00004314001 [Paramecium tetraurelia]CAK56220.1 unnamed protein product [Paramecium tetraurelia]|eukprot:XP_001423618.1 hypothetical protein (macronuclear) [Paramecium tetraurelia strain d4-2]